MQNHLFLDEHMMIKELLQALIRHVDAQLLEAIDTENLCSNDQYAANAYSLAFKVLIATVWSLDEVLTHYSYFYLNCATHTHQPFFLVFTSKPAISRMAIQEDASRAFLTNVYGVYDDGISLGKCTALVKNSLVFYLFIK